MRQLVLDLPHAPGHDAEDFLIGPSNRAASALIDSWPDWPDRLVVLTGPPGSGKTHLAAIWAARAGAATLAARDVVDRIVLGLAEAPALVVEDLDRGPLDESALFHLVNLARERGRDILFTSAAPISADLIALPDLASRLRLAPAVALGPPDDALLKAVLVKLFHDRQLAVDITVIDYVALRIERSLARAAELVAELDRETLSRGRSVSRPMAAEIVGRGSALAEDGG